jgi:KaiC/GvpD/RAD55 family RecA-like ATPase
MLYVRSGISDLDHHLGGGLAVVPDSIVSGSEEDVYLFSQQLLWNRLNAGDFCFYGTISRTREEVVVDLLSREWDVSPYIKAGMLKVADFLSLIGEDEKTTDERLETFLSLDENAIVPENYFQVLLKEFVSWKGYKTDRIFTIFFDSIDKLITLVGLDDTLRLNKLMFSLLKDVNALGVALLCNEYVSSEELETVKNVVRVFIEVELKQSNFEFQVTKSITK